jgi:hypothetical protein
MTDVDRPDLQCLERVEERIASTGGSIVALTLVCAVLGVFVWSCIMYWDYMGSIAPAFCGFAALFVAVLVTRELLSFHTYTTGPDGIELRGAIRQLYIRWTDVTRATRKQDNYWSAFHRLLLQTAERKVRLHPYLLPSEETTGSVFLASVWQHLRRYGKHEDLHLPPSSLSLWQTEPAVASDGEEQGKWSGKAYLLTLSPQVRRRIRELDNNLQITCMIPMICLFVLAFLDVPARVSQLVFSRADTVGFSTSCTGVIILALLFPAAIAIPLLLLPLGAKRAGEYRAEWEEYLRRGAFPLSMRRSTLGWLAAAAGVVSVVAFFCYARVTTSGIDVARPLRFRPDHYSWQQVTSIKWSRDSHRNVRYRVRFDDGDSWSAEPGNEMDNGKRLRAAVSEISRRSGKPITYE